MHSLTVLKASFVIGFAIGRSILASPPGDPPDESPHRVTAVLPKAAVAVAAALTQISLGKPGTVIEIPVAFEVVAEPVINNAPEKTQAESCDSQPQQWVKHPCPNCPAGYWLEPIHEDDSPTPVVALQRPEQTPIDSPARVPQPNCSVPATQRCEDPATNYLFRGKRRVWGKCR